MGEVKKFKVQFSVTYEVEIECVPKDLPGLVSDIYIPADSQTKYIEDSFEVISMESYP